MKINAQEMLFSKQSKKFSRGLSNEPSTASEPTVNSPESTMKAMKLQGMNNVSFQSVKALKSLEKPLEKSALKFMFYLATLAGAGLATTSCEPLFKVEANQSVQIDLTTVTSLLEQLLEQGKINQTKYDEIVNELRGIRESVNSIEEYQKKACEYYMNDAEMQKLIYEQLIKNGESQESANEVLNEIYALMDQGNYAEALNRIETILGSIENAVKDIRQELIALRKDINANHQEKMEAEAKTHEYLNRLYNQGELNFKMVAELREIIKHIDKSNAAILAQAEALLEIAKDDTKHKELIEAIKSIDSYTDYVELTDALKVLGISITEAVEMSADQLEAALKTFIDTYKETEAQKSADLNAKYEKIMEAFNKLISQVGDLSGEISTYNRIFAANWEKSMDYFLALEGQIKQIFEAQNKTNLNLENIKQSQEYGNKYLDALNEKVNEQNELIKKLVNNNPGITYAELKKALAEFGGDVIVNFEQLALDLGIDKLVENSDLAIKYLDVINSKIGDKNELNGRLDKIIAKLDGMDFTLEENQEYLKKILDAIMNHKCDCDCAGGNHEGILGDVLG